MMRHAELLPRYKRLRKAALRLNNRLVKTLSRSVLDEGGKKLGILQGNVLTLDSEDEIAVLMDYCIYDVRRRGANAVERDLAKSPPTPESDEMTLLQAMRQAYYSLFAVEAVERGVGVHVKDLLRDESLFLVDVGFGSSAPLGMILAARVTVPEGIAMTTGAALPFGVLSAAEMPYSCKVWQPCSQAWTSAAFPHKKQAICQASSFVYACNKAPRSTSDTRRLIRGRRRRGRAGGATAMIGDLSGLPEKPPRRSSRPSRASDRRHAAASPTTRSVRISTRIGAFRSAYVRT